MAPRVALNMATSRSSSVGAGESGLDPVARLRFPPRQQHRSDRQPVRTHACILFGAADPAGFRVRVRRQAGLIAINPAQIPVIYFLGTSPGCYQPIIPTFIVGWHPERLRVQLAFGAIVGALAAQPDTGRSFGSQHAAGRCGRSRRAYSRSIA
jgi:hypothetical protein